MDILRRQQDRTLASWARAQGLNVTDKNIVLSGPPEQYPAHRLPEHGHEGLETGWFQAFIPLPFFPDESELEHLAGPSGLENLRTLAISRLMLDNFPHIKAFWIMQTLPMAQVMLLNGADDIDGTVVWYDITHLDGSTTHQETTAADLKRAIREAGLEPVERRKLGEDSIQAPHQMSLN
jgi:2-iminoacetate synthase ThiH